MGMVDLYWQHDKRWYYYDELIPKIKEDAPADVKESFDNYIRQLASKYQNDRQLKM